MGVVGHFVWGCRFQFREAGPYWCHKGLPIARSMLEARASLDAATSSGRTALHLAVEHDQEQALQVLCAHPGTKVRHLLQQTPNGASPFCLAERRGKPSLILPMLRCYHRHLRERYLAGKLGDAGDRISDPSLTAMCLKYRDTLFLNDGEAAAKVVSQSAKVACLQLAPEKEEEDKLQKVPVGSWSGQGAVPTGVSRAVGACVRSWTCTSSGRGPSAETSQRGGSPGVLRWCGSAHPLPARLLQIEAKAPPPARPPPSCRGYRGQRRRLQERCTGRRCRLCRVCRVCRVCSGRRGRGGRCWPWRRRMRCRTFCGTSCRKGRSQRRRYRRWLAAGTWRCTLQMKSHDWAPKWAMPRKSRGEHSCAAGLGGSQVSGECPSL